MSRPFELRYHKSQPQLEFTNEAKRLQSIDGKVVNNRSALGQLQVSLFIETDGSFLSCGLPDTDSSFVFRAMSYFTPVGHLRLSPTGDGRCTDVAYCWPWKNTEVCRQFHPHGLWLLSQHSTFVSTSNERELLFSFSEDISSKLLGINQLFPRSHAGTKSLVRLLVLSMS